MTKTLCLGRRAAAALFAASMLFPATVVAQTAMQPGEAFVTGFSGTATQGGRTVLDPQGPVGSILDLRAPSAPPQGQHESAPRRPVVTAGQVGQVFGIALDDADSPNVYLTATSAFGLHRTSDNSDWMAGMWGQGGDAGTVYKLDAANGLTPTVFAHITLNGRANSGAALGNIAYDRWHKQFYVSDLETGMIHRLRLSDGADLGHYDHGVAGRTGFFDAPTNQLVPLPPVPFNPASAARVTDCPGGDFAKTPACWNFADFRRRVWGLAVRHDPNSDEVRLYYAIWGSQGFGNPDFAGAGDDARNSVWSVRIGDKGDFDLTSVRREFFLPDFFRSPEDIARSGRSSPVSDIAFPAFGDQAVMLVAERGGVRNLGLGAQDAFARPHESRVLRYELSEEGIWQLAGRYDVGFDDRKSIGPPFIRANADGGVSFGMGYDEAGAIDPASADSFVWISGSNLCSANGPCLNPSTGQHDDATRVDGLQGRPAQPYDAAEPVTAFEPYPASGSATPLTGVDNSFMIDAAGAGDVQVFQTEAPAVSEAAPTAPEAGVEEVPPEGGVEIWGWEPAPLPPDGWPLPPPEHLNTDLAIHKTGPAQCQWGVTCAYGIDITNSGSADYTGPLAVNDTMPEGATLSGGPAGWHCDVAGRMVSCRTLGDAALPVGTTATLHLTIQLPADGAGDHVENCAAIDWPEMGTDDGPDGNDRDCVETPVVQGFDLGLQKNGPAQCAENANCIFGVTITNFGPGQFDGILAVRDHLPHNATLASAGPPWNCVQTGDEVACQRPAVTLPAAASAGLNLHIKLPDGIAPTSVDNCADIDWATMGADDGAADTHVDHNCHTVNVIDGAGFFDLSIKKVGPSRCDAGADCAYSYTVTNNGSDDYTGGLSITDNPPAGAIRTGGPLGTICAFALPGAPFTCSLLGPAITLHPGESRNFDVTIRLPDPVAGASVINCIDLNWGGAGMPADDNPAPGGGDKPDFSCALTPVGAGFDIEIAKEGPGSCYEGHLCDYTLRFTNNGPAAYHGSLLFSDTPPPNAILQSAAGATTCPDLGVAGTVNCNMFVGVLPPGETRSITLSVLLPDPVVGDTATNCATLKWAPPPAGMTGPAYTGDDDNLTDGPACASVPVFAADLAPYGATTCDRGTTCLLKEQIDNRGGREFRGSAGLRGTLDPAVTISSIKSLTRGLSCRVTGKGRYACQAQMLTLKPKEAARLQLSIVIPKDFPYNRIIHRKEMVWPDSRVKDKKPENDRHTSTIFIPGPKPPPSQCAGGEIRGGECVCPPNALRKQTGPNAFACVVAPVAPVPPPPVVEPEQPPPGITQCINGRLLRGRCICPSDTRPSRTGPRTVVCVPEIVCRGGVVRRGECFCPKGTERRRDGRNAYTCVEPPPRIVCNGGQVRRGECFCPKGTDRRRDGRNRYTCVEPPPRIVCNGGQVRRGECFCPKGTERRRDGRNRYTCVKPPPRIVCSGGKVSRGQCICPRGTERQRRGANAYACVKPAPRIVCSGGKVSRGQCICPRGTNRQRRGANAYACVKPAPRITCAGGKVSRGQCICPRGTTRQRMGRNSYKCAPQHTPQIQTPTIKRAVPRIKRAPTLR